MSLKLYDDAITKKISEWTKDTDIHIYSPNSMKNIMEIRADENNDNPIKLPIITISRNGGYDIIDTLRQPLSYDGLSKDASYERTLQINAIKINIHYQIDVYTRYLEEADELVRNFVFNIVNFPTLIVHLPYNGVDIEHDSALTLASSVEDNSDIPERMVKGQFTRFTLQVDINDAYLWDIRYRDNIHIDPNLTTIS